MKVTIVVDANVILAALLGGSARFIIFRANFNFVTTEFTIAEVEKYLDLVSEKSGVDKKEILYALNLMPLQIYSQSFYQKEIKSARKIIGHIDPKDTDILSLALKLNTYLWTNDKHFDKIKNQTNIHIIKTENLI